MGRLRPLAAAAIGGRRLSPAARWLAGLLCLWIWTAQASPAADEAWLRRAAQLAQTSAQAAALARQHGTSGEVQAYARQAAARLQDLGRELADVAHAQEVTLPAGPDATQRTHLQELARQRDAAFDRVYLHWAGVALGEETLRHYRQAADGAQAAPVREFAVHAVPMLQDLLQDARRLAQPPPQAEPRKLPPGGPGEPAPTSPASPRAPPSIDATRPGR
ncbi:DUF4142 domain-containing protein [Bordetella bronchiseptica]|uniref:DUF4142 domain-containing protein n=1 Tax=Bordetella bronchiseptica TaxID=518 RepID=UPI0010F31830|nr:DUF4142 domain-containing protein [Bordetella bronchiseptica]VTQ82294.1 Predicted outer membrane protein [Bordetella bronchiseptica]